MEVSPRLETPGVSAYPRSAVDEFLASGELEAHRLEQAIATAHVRTERATFVTERAEAISEMLHSILQDLRREFADRRLQVEAQAEGIVAAAHDEAARLLADARRDALEAAAKPQARAARPTIDSPVPAPNYRWVAASPPTPAEPATNPVPLTVSDATRPADLGTNGAGSPGVSTVAPVPDLAPARGLDVSGARCGRAGPRERLPRLVAGHRYLRGRRRRHDHHRPHGGRARPSASRAEPVAAQPPP
jgi:hypothetical protein